jgi:hypothetical protein
VGTVGPLADYSACSDWYSEKPTDSRSYYGNRKSVSTSINAPLISTIERPRNADQEKSEEKQKARKRVVKNSFFSGRG